MSELSARAFWSIESVRFLCEVRMTFQGQDMELPRFLEMSLVCGLIAVSPSVLYVAMSCCGW